jgi:hypothetical protein
VIGAVDGSRIFGRSKACLYPTLLFDLQRAVIVAMAVMRVMQVAVYQVVDMISMRHRIMAAIGTVHVPFLVANTLMIGRASVRVRCVHFNHVFINMIPVHMVQVPVMKIIDVFVMTDRLMPAVWPVLVRVASMLLAFVHHNSSTA